jgi:tetratricopeptide (TPR) repeat protein
MFRKIWLLALLCQLTAGQAIAFTERPPVDLFSYGIIDSRGNFIYKPQAKLIQYVATDRFLSSNGLDYLEKKNFEILDWNGHVMRSGSDADSLVRQTCGDLTLPADIPGYIKGQRFHEELLDMRSMGTSGFGFVDLHGQFVIKPRFAEGKYFSEGLAPVNELAGSHRVGYYIDHSGQKVLGPYEGTLGEPFINGRAIIPLYDFHGQCHAGAIDHSGKFVVRPVYSALKRYGSDKFIATDCDVKILLDNDGKQVMQFPDNCGEIGGMVYADESPFYSSNSKWDDSVQRYPATLNLVRAVNVVESPFPCTNLDTRSKGATRDNDDSRWQYVDENGKVVLPPVYCSASTFQNGTAVVSIKDAAGAIKFGVIDKFGKWILEPKYDVLVRCGADRYIAAFPKEQFPQTKVAPARSAESIQIPQLNLPILFHSQAPLKQEIVHIRNAASKLQAANLAIDELQTLSCFYRIQKDYARAVDALSRAIALDKELETAQHSGRSYLYEQRGELYQLLGDEKASLADYELAHVSPGSDRFCTMMDLMLENKQFEEVERICSANLKTIVSCPLFLYRAKANNALGYKEKALADANEALYLAVLFDDRKEEAVKALTDLLGHSPSLPEPDTQKGREFLNQLKTFALDGKPITDSTGARFWKTQAVVKNMGNKISYVGAPHNVDIKSASAKLEGISSVEINAQHQAGEPSDIRISINPYRICVTPKLVKEAFGDARFNDACRSGCIQSDANISYSDKSGRLYFCFAPNGANVLMFVMVSRNGNNVIFPIPAERNVHREPAKISSEQEWLGSFIASWEDEKSKSALGPEPIRAWRLASSKLRAMISKHYQESKRADIDGFIQAASTAELDARLGEIGRGQRRELPTITESKSEKWTVKLFLHPEVPGVMCYKGGWSAVNVSLEDGLKNPTVAGWLKKLGDLKAGETKQIAPLSPALVDALNRSYLPHKS